MTEDEIVAAFLATRKGLDDRTARIIAAWWHSGQRSALYSFASCGNVTTAAINEALSEIKEVENNPHLFEGAGEPGPEFQIKALRKLIAYLRSHKSQKGAQTGWDARTSY